VRELLEECNTPPGDLPADEADVHWKSAAFASFFFSFGFLAATVLWTTGDDTRVSPPVVDSGPPPEAGVHHRSPEWDPDEVIPVGERHQTSP
jgi:hypothetical protein